MGLAKMAVTVAPQIMATKTIDVSKYAGDGATVTFRDPTTADLFAVPARLDRVRASFPELPASLLKQALLLAGCYVPDAEDAPGTDPDVIIATFARDNRDLFVDMLGQFVVAFPIAAALSATDAGNA